MTAVPDVPRGSVAAMVPDDPAARVREHRAGPLLVLGGPGTGKSTLAVELVASRIDEGLDPGRVLALCATRRASVALRDRIVARVGRTIREPLARTAHSYAFGLLRREAAMRAEPAPRLLGAAEQEVVIAELLQGWDVPWPPDLAEAVSTRHFTRALRDLLLRALERDVTPEMLTELGRRHGRPAWQVAGRFAAEYADVTALAQPSAYDPAELVRAAVDLLRGDADLRDRERRDRALVVVDDLDEADTAMLDLVEVLAGDGGTLVATADPDSTVLGFRGADPQAVRSFPERFATSDGSPAPEVVLRAGYRMPRAVLDVATALTTRLGGAGRWRSPSPAPHEGSVDVRVLGSPADEMTQVAAHCRRRHLRDGVPWQHMAVVVRSAADLAGVRRALARRGVPVEQRRDEVALWQQPPVRALLDLLALASGDDDQADDTVVDLMLGPLGRLDPAALAGLRRDVLSNGQVASGDVDALLAAAVLEGRPLPGDVSHPAVTALATTLEAGRAALAAGGSLEDVMWALWDAVGVGGRWRRAALAGGRDGAVADRDLDALVAVFDSAATFVDRLPGAGPRVFLDHVLQARLPGDGWGTSSGAGHAVAVVTAHATKGAEYDTVVVARVQEERWPDVRRRETLLGVDDLVAVTQGGRVPTPAEQATALLAAERRLLHLAVSRARCSLLVTAVEDEELRPSRFIDELGVGAPGPAPGPGEHRAESSVSTVLPDPVLELTSLVAELRARVCTSDAPDDERHEAARLLARLAAAGVPGADPASWYGLVPLSDDAPLVDPGDVALSPSQVESYLRCPLRWMLQRSGGDDGAVLRRTIGSLVHQLAFEATTDHLDDEAVWQRFEQLWSSVDAGRGWVARRERARVTDMVRRLLHWLAEHADTAVAAEAEVNVQADGTQVHGRLDRLDRAEDGSLVVVDFKTGTSAPTNAEAASNPQLGVYQWAVEQCEPHGGAPARAGGGMLVHLGVSGERARTQHQPALSDSNDPDWPRRLIDQVADGATQTVFAAFVNPGCGGCPVRTSCPAQPAGGQVSP